MLNYGSLQLSSKPFRVEWHKTFGNCVRGNKITYIAGRWGRLVVVDVSTVSK